ADRGVAKPDTGQREFEPQGPRAAAPAYGGWRDLQTRTAPDHLFLPRWHPHRSATTGPGHWHRSVIVPAWPRLAYRALPATSPHTKLTTTDFPAAFVSWGETKAPER